MAFSCKIVPFDRTVLFSGSGRAFADFARAEIAAAAKANAEALGQEPPHKTYINGSESESLERVKPGGSAVTVFDIHQGVVAFCFAKAKEFAPVLSGEYRASIRIYADDAEVGTPAEAEGAQEVVIAATVVYARKIEGVAGKAPLSKQAPDGVMQAVALLASSRFGNSARIKFSYRSISGVKGLDDYSASRARRTGKSSAKEHARDTRLPCIVITQR